MSFQLPGLPGHREVSYYRVFLGHRHSYIQEVGGGHLRVSADRTSATTVSGPSPRSGAPPPLPLSALTFLHFETSGALILFSPSVYPFLPFPRCPVELTPFHSQPPARMTPIFPQPSVEAAPPPHLCLGGTIRDHCSHPFHSDVYP